jgi:tRNA-modifying protein YgfZ
MGLTYLRANDRRGIDRPGPTRHEFHRGAHPELALPPRDTTMTSAAPASSSSSSSLPLVLAASHAAERTTLVVTGSERLTWLNGLVTCDLKKVDERTGAYGLIVGKTGKIQADVAIVAHDEALYVSVPASKSDALLAMFDTYLVMEDAEFAVAADIAFVRIVGEGAEALGETGTTGAAITSVSLPWFGEAGRAVLVARAQVDKILDELGAAGATVLDEAGWAALCVAHGIPRYGFDFDEGLYPQEAGLEKRAVSFTKGCYLGQEVVHTLEIRGRANRRLLAFSIEAPAAEASALVGAALTADGQTVGKITSTTPGPKQGGSVEGDEAKTSMIWALGLAKVAAVTAAGALEAGGYQVRIREVPEAR